MSSVLRTPRWALAAGLAVVAACGGGADPSVRASLEAPTPRAARVALTPALDVSGLIDPALADRIVIEEIQVGLSDLRLLGSNPAIPSGGHPLVVGSRTLSSVDEAANVFPFPASMLDDDLAVYARIDRAPMLGGASVVVRARLYDRPVHAQAQRLTSDEAPNPDGEPAAPNPDGEPAAPNPDGEPAAPNPDGEPAAPNPDGEPAAPNPDGEPAAPNPDGEPAAPNPDGEPAAPNPDGEPAAPNPDGEPARCVDAICTLKRALSDAHGADRSVAFELRGEDVEDLVIGFDRDSHMNVLIGVPARRWFSADVIADLEHALSQQGTLELGAGAGSDHRQAKVIVDRTRAAQLDSGRGEGGSTMPGEDESYRLVDRDEGGDPRGLRRR